MMFNFTMTVDLTVMNQNNATHDLIYTYCKISNGIPEIYMLLEFQMSEHALCSTIKQFVDACTVDNLIFFIYGGSMFGACRHHVMHGALR